MRRRAVVGFLALSLSGLALAPAAIAGETFVSITPITFEMRVWHKARVNVDRVTEVRPAPSVEVRSCQLRMPTGSNGHAVLEAAKDAGCIRTYAAGAWYIDCIDEVCNNRVVVPGPFAPSAIAGGTWFTFPQSKLADYRAKAATNRFVAFYEPSARACVWAFVPFTSIGVNLCPAAEVTKANLTPGALGR